MYQQYYFSVKEVNSWSIFNYILNNESFFFIDQDAKEQQQSYMAHFVSLLQVWIYSKFDELNLFLFIKDLSCYVNRCNEVVMSILQQLSALYTPPGVQNGRWVFLTVRDEHLYPNFFLDPCELWMCPIYIYQYEVFIFFCIC